MATTPGVRDDLTVLLCLEKKLTGSCSWGFLSGIIISQLLDTDHTGATILGYSDLLLHENRLGGGGLLCNLLLGEFVNGFLVVCRALTEPVHTTLKGVITGLALILVLSHYFSCRSESSNISL